MCVRTEKLQRKYQHKSIKLSTIELCNKKIIINIIIMNTEYVELFYAPDKDTFNLIIQNYIADLVLRFFSFFV